MAGSPAQARVQRCGKSAPAASRGAGSVNPGWEQGQGTMAGHLPRSDLCAARGRRQRRSQIDNHPPSADQPLWWREQNPAYVLLSPLIQSGVGQHTNKQTAGAAADDWPARAQ